MKFKFDRYRDGAKMAEGRETEAQSLRHAAEKISGETWYGNKCHVLICTDDPRISDLEAELAEARKDTERLTYLEENPESGEPQIVFHPPSDLITWRCHKTDLEYRTLRAAIDAARKEPVGE